MRTCFLTAARRIIGDLALPTLFLFLELLFILTLGWALSILVLAHSWSWSSAHLLLDVDTGITFGLPLQILVLFLNGLFFRNYLPECRPE